RLLPSVGGRPLPARTLNLAEGRNATTFDFVAGESGEFALELRIEVDFDQPTLDDSRVAYTRASGDAPVLVIGDPAAARLLRGQGFTVREGSVESVREPFSPSAVVLRASATEFTPSQLTVLANYVRDGGGLMLTGGPQSFGLGAWARTPVESLLPVSTDLRTRVDVPLVALMIVLDRSLSMSGGGFGATGSQKLALAVEGAGNVIELAHERDLIGMITFSDTPKWVFKPMRATDSNRLQMLRAATAITSEGGTVLEPAYREAVDALKSVQAAIKHIILLTDGQLADDQLPGAAGRAPDFAAIAASARAAGITTSSIAIGGDADMPRLRQIAAAGKGRFYSALDVDTLPRIFTTEALTATRTLVRTERFTPTLVKHPLAAAVRSDPAPLTSYVATTLRASGEPILVGLDREPVLAVTRKGLGRTVALTADLNRLDPFTTWRDLPALIGTVTRWLQSPPAPYALRVTPDGRQAVVDAVSQNQYVNGQRLELRAGGKSIQMVQTAPGRYEASLPSEASGSAVLINGGLVVARTRLEPPTRELETSGGLEVLRRLAEATGGRVLESLDGYPGATKDERVPLAPWFALAAALIFLAELAWRRFRL
ncbi:MAG TPA: VWA domain-containing protein, partial [Deinococcales bacterium]|nr:VWA domain-containing protein [Deinococcales bacterium]